MTATNTNTLASDKKGQDGKKYKILLVEDDKFFLNLYTTKFTILGHEVVSAESGIEALAKIKDGFKPDIMVCDLIMPGMNGVELIETVRKDKLLPSTTIVALTNESDSAKITKVMSLGVATFIVKATKTPSEVLEEVLAARAGK